MLNQNEKTPGRLHASSPRKIRGFTLLEIMIGLIILGILGSLGGLGLKKIRDHARTKGCILQQDRLWEAKRGAWGAYEDLTTRADPDQDIIDFCDEKSLLFCPSPGAHRPSGTAVATVANTLASYNLLATSEDEHPVCRIDPTNHVKTD